MFVWRCVPSPCAAAGASPPALSPPCPAHTDGSAWSDANTRHISNTGLEYYVSNPSILIVLYYWSCVGLTSMSGSSVSPIRSLYVSGLTCNSQLELRAVKACPYIYADMWTKAGSSHFGTPGKIMAPPPTLLDGAASQVNQSLFFLYFQERALFFEGLMAPPLADGALGGHLCQEPGLMLTMRQQNRDDRTRAIGIWYSSQIKGQ